jgi:hypothetical protein
MSHTSQNRYKGIECDQCGRPVDNGLRLEFSVRSIYTSKPIGKHPIYDAQFYADFCSKECMHKFIDRHYFETILEVEENE